ncbi:non-hydrolyzing UDP-N-acetylglucosamine 2-epimerase [Spirosoma fluviale]|uniref:UDP-N-acetylglucosamine 2-epimerase (Non-hydrolysing) n=1 Tax=Spirosoma fluviale TaxID=1597977 RepID=A0A286G3Q0_9BACT|nr:UDP-N-acetylglucosamine 2-epimerase (non-hydrolyzing) [Spirosoma fluviale]SOD90197.1 UDP-N-acetylglucosamine 2-epimerase (non-hydrolysing) [Spirosoma fluviale]
MKIISVVGTRPNFMKVAPLHRALLTQPGVQSILVHTGQHYDDRLNEVFMKQLKLPPPDYCLAVVAGTASRQTAEIIQKFEGVLRAEQPDWVVVVGDVTSTLAGALTAVQLGIRVAHVEAGLRSGDRQMPEEINRILVDSMADLLFVTEQAGLDNLLYEGIPTHKTHFVGNVMIDSLVQHRSKANALNTVGTLGLTPKRYALLTMHRPVNVDTESGLNRLIQLIHSTAQHLAVLFPVHPRTRARLEKFGLMPELMALENVRLLAPQGYLEFLNLMEHAAVVITDSGGIQEETTYLNVPCLTFRTSTERPVTIDLGTNQLLPDLNPATVRQKLVAILNGQTKTGQIPPLWDGKAADRIVTILAAAGQLNA